MTLFQKMSLLVPVLALAACTGMQATTDRPAGTAQQAAAEGTPPTSEELTAAAAITRAPPPRPRARSTAAQLDTTTSEQKAAAAAPAEKPETRLGTTIASLGDVSEPGFWIKTPLVNAPAKGRIEAANGKSVQVDLIPLDGDAGAGSQVSLPALRLLDVPLTDLPELSVFRL